MKGHVHVHAQEDTCTLQLEGRLVADDLALELLRLLFHKLLELRFGISRVCLGKVLGFPNLGVKQ